MRTPPELDPDVAGLARRYGLSTAAADALSTLLELMITDPLAPTAIRDRQRALEDHLADSLVALEIEEVRRARKIADLGTGAGFPGLPLAIALPRAEVDLVEANSHKAEFVGRAFASAGITNARTVWARAEAWRDGLGRFDIVTARALGPMDVVAEYAAPLLKVGGTVVIWRGRRDPGAEARARSAGEILGLAVGEVRRVRPYTRAEHRHLHLMSKVSDTPASFPRRPGVARKRPLGDEPSSDRPQR